MHYCSFDSHHNNREIVLPICAQLPKHRETPTIDKRGKGGQVNNKNLEKKLMRYKNLEKASFEV